MFFFVLKIIKRAREKHLMKKYMDDTSIPLEKVLEDCQLALKVIYQISKQNKFVFFLARQRCSIT